LRKYGRESRNSKPGFNPQIIMREFLHNPRLKNMEQGRSDDVIRKMLGDRSYDMYHMHAKQCENFAAIAAKHGIKENCARTTYRQAVKRLSREPAWYDSAGKKAESFILKYNIKSKEALEQMFLSGRLVPGCLIGYGSRTHREVSIFLGLGEPKRLPRTTRRHLCERCLAEVASEIQRILDAPLTSSIDGDQSDRLLSADENQ